MAGPKKKLEGKVAIITGAASVSARRLRGSIASMAARCSASTGTKERHTRIAGEIRSDGGEFIDVFADVCDEDSVIAFFKKANDAGAT